MAFQGPLHSQGNQFIFPLMLTESLWLPLQDQVVKNLPAMQESQVQSLGWEEPLEKGMATHCSILAWRIPVDRGAWRATAHGLTKSPRWLSTSIFTFHFQHWRWEPLQQLTLSAEKGDWGGLGGGGSGTNSHVHTHTFSGVQGHLFSF